MPAKQNLEGKSFISKYGEQYTVIDYKNCDNLTIMFNDGVTEFTKAVNIRNGNVPYGMRKTTLGIGYTGVGYHQVTENGKKTSAYLKWQAMLHRVYGKRYTSNKCYDNTEVNSEWFNFQNFANWYHEQLNEVEYHDDFCLEKDIIVPNSNLYSKDTCCIVPYEINIAIQLGEPSRYRFDRDCWVVSLDRKYGGRLRYSSSNKEIADNFYFYEKDTYIKFLVDKNKKYLKDDVINALINFNSRKRWETRKGQK
jgi:hypothetical protein